MFPIPIIIGAGGGGKKLTTLNQLLDAIVRNINFILIFIVAVSFVYILFRLFVHFRRRKVKRIRFLLHRLYSEIILGQKCQVALDTLSKIGFSEKETLNLISKEINKKFFAKKIGKHCLDRMLDGLALIKSDKVDFECKKSLVKCWIGLFNFI